jgi:hypothetical protein
MQMRFRATIYTYLNETNGAAARGTGIGPRYNSGCQRADEPPGTADHALVYNGCT